MNEVIVIVLSVVMAALLLHYKSLLHGNVKAKNYFFETIFISYFFMLFFNFFMDGKIQSYFT